MNESLRWLLGLDRLGWDQPGVEFGFTHQVPAWAWALAGVVALVVALLSYRRLEGSRHARSGLAIMRAAILMLIAVLLAGPRLVKPNETEEKDWLVVLTDRSASMAIRDVTSATAAGGRMSREEQLQQILRESTPTWESLAKSRVVKWLGFGPTAFELAADGRTGAVPPLGDPTGRRTAVDRALQQALTTAAARPVSGIVLLTDGRSVDAPVGEPKERDAAPQDLALSVAVRELVNQKIPVFAVALGNDKPIADWSIRRVEAAHLAFAADLLPVTVEVERTGAPEPGAENGAVLQLVDRSTGVVLDERRLNGDGKDDAGGSTITLATRPAKPGAAEWEVRLRPSATDLVQENNSQEISMEVVDRPLRVVLFDGSPRWEYRYLKNLLVREESCKASTLILSSGRRYLQEGDEILDRLPSSPEEWAPIDVVIMGDVHPEVFSAEQIEQLRDHIAFRGAGLIWIGGEGATPGAWAGTPLADLLPFRLGSGDDTGGPTSDSAAGLLACDGGVVMRPTALAERLGVLRLAETEEDGSWWPRKLGDPATGWSVLRWAQRIEWARLKPGAEVLATGVAADNFVAVGDGAAGPPAPAAAQAGATGPEELPLVLSMRFGAGLSLYVATDEIWRWRYGRGEFYPERFWIQMVRLLGRESLSRAGKRATIEVTPDRTVVQNPVRIAVELLDQSLVDAAPDAIRLRIHRTGGVGGAATNGAAPDGTDVELLLQPEGSGPATERARRAGSASRLYSALYVPAESGKFVAEATEPVLAGVGGGSNGALAAEFESWLPDDELRRPETDHAMLARLCSLTGGRVLREDEIAKLPELLPNRRVRLIGSPDEETLWDSPGALLALLMLLTMEWVGRRLIRLA